MDEVTTTKMEGPGQVMTKNPKKIEVGKRLAEYNHRKRGELTKAQKSENESKLTSGQCYGCWGIRPSWLLCLLIQERRHHQDESSSLIQGRRHHQDYSSSTLRTSNP